MLRRGHQKAHGRGCIKSWALNQGKVSRTLVGRHCNRHCFYVGKAPCSLSEASPTTFAFVAAEEGTETALPVVRLPSWESIGLTMFSKLHIHNESRWQILPALSTKSASDSIIILTMSFASCHFSQELCLTVRKGNQSDGLHMHFLWLSPSCPFPPNMPVGPCLTYSSFGQHQGALTLRIRFKSILLPQQNPPRAPWVLTLHYVPSKP